MELTITARHFKARKSLKDLITEKMGGLSKYNDNIIDCEVVMCEEHDSKIAEVKVHINNKVIVLKEATDNMYKSIELVTARLQRQLSRQKERRKRGFDHNKMVDKIQPPAPVIEDEYDML